MVSNDMVNLCDEFLGLPVFIPPLTVRLNHFHISLLRYDVEVHTVNNSALSLRTGPKRRVRGNRRETNTHGGYLDCDS